MRGGPLGEMITMADALAATADKLADASADALKHSETLLAAASQLRQSAIAFRDAVESKERALKLAVERIEPRGSA